MTSISVITPSFNQAAFLPHCIRSVKEQTLAPIEHLIFDPGSSDRSIEIARTAEGVTLINEPDNGQADAVGKGFTRAKGDIIAWLNSDDEYFDSLVFDSVAARFAGPDKPDIVYGRAIWIDVEGHEIRPVWINSDPERLPISLHDSVGIAQPAVFIRKSTVDRIGIPDKRLHFAMDYEFWIRAVLAGLKFAFIDRPLAKLRYYPSNKTAGQRGESYAEICHVVKENFGYVSVKWLRRYAEFNLSGADGVLTAAPSGLAKAAVEQETARLAQLYNTDYRTLDLLAANRNTEPYKPTANFVLSLASVKSRPWEEVPLEQRTTPGCRLYTVGPKRFAFKNEWLKRQFLRTEGMLQYLTRVARSDTCIIVGNGPSLNHVNFDLLADQDVLASNYAFLHSGLRDKITILTVVNYMVAEQAPHDFMRREGCYLILPFWLRYAIGEKDNIFFANSVGLREFSLDLTANISWRSTVSFFNMQLAFGLGYRKALLVGFDHSYVQPAELKEGDVIDQRADDPNHFSPYYFHNKQWQAADTSLMEEMYLLAKNAFQLHGREIVNCTVGGHLEVFPRGDLAAELAAATRSCRK